MLWINTLALGLVFLFSSFYIWFSLGRPVLGHWRHHQNNKYLLPLLPIPGIPPILQILIQHLNKELSFPFLLPKKPIQQILMQYLYITSIRNTCNLLSFLPKYPLLVYCKPLSRIISCTNVLRYLPWLPNMRLLIQSLNHIFVIPKSQNYAYYAMVVTYLCLSLSLPQL